LFLVTEQPFARGLGPHQAGVFVRGTIRLDLWRFFIICKAFPRNKCVPLNEKVIQMKLTILQLGQTPASMRDNFAPYHEMFVSMFSSVGETYGYEIVDIPSGQEIPSPNDLEAALITGSAASVYENLEWMEPLRIFVRNAHKINLPMLGICFGHQIIAAALGGKVEKSAKGWGLGRHLYQVQNINAFTKKLPDQLAVPASHQDQVIVAPKETEVFLSSSFTPNAGLIYANKTTLSLQPHPEFSVAYASALSEVRRNNPLSENQVDSAIESLKGPLDNDHVARMLADFLFAAEKIRK